MKKKMVYWAIFFTPGLFVAETWDKDFKKQPEPEEVEFPERAYAFQLYKREDVIDGGRTYKGKPEKIGKLCYHKDSKVTTIAEVKKMQGDNKTLISNMECNKWNKVIWTRWGNWPQPYEPKSVCVVSP